MNWITSMEALSDSVMFGNVALQTTLRVIRNAIVLITSKTWKVMEVDYVRSYVGRYHWKHIMDARMN